MLIKSVAVQNYRTIRHAKVDFTAGLNVVHGPNDTGKSTLLDAMRAALVRPGRLTGKTLVWMSPCQGGQPQVELCFEHDGAEYQVHKKFGVNGSTRLHRRTGGGILREVHGDADEELFRVLGIGERRTARGAQDVGILPLIWVRQGTSGTAPCDIVAGDAGKALNVKLAELSGSVLDGAGAEHVFATVRAEYERHFTEQRSGVRKGSPLFLALEEVQQVQAELDGLRVRRDELEGLFEERRRCEGQRSALTERRPLLAEEARKAAATWERIQSLLTARATAAAEAKAGALTAEDARQKVARRHAAQREIAELRAELAGHDRAVDEAAGSLRAHDAAREDLAGQEQSTATAERAAALRDRTTRARIDLLQESGVLAALEARLVNAESIQRSLVELHGQLGGMRMDAAGLERLRKLEREAETAVAALVAVSASVEIVALRDGSIGIDAAASALRAGERVSHHVDARTTLRIGDLAEVIVNPGGSGLSAARDAARTKRAAFDRALAAASVANLAEAGAAVEARQAVVSAIAVAEARLGVVAPAGLPRLQEQCAAQRAKTRAAQALLEGSPADVAGAETVEEARAQAEAAERDHQEARAAAEQARAALARYDAQRGELLASWRIAETKAAGARGRLSDLEATYARSLSADGSDAALADRARTADAAADDAGRVLAGVDAQLTGIDPETARLRAEAAARASAAAEGDAERLEREIHGLDVRLDEADALDVNDRLQAADNRLADARKSEGRARETAEDVQLLYEFLCVAREEAQTRFLAPLSTEVERLVRQLDPTSKIALDPAYGVQLERDGFGSHGFDDLGGGCQEQIAIAVRLAMAGILAGDGVLPVLFDDAMVNTDDARFDRMADVLLRMASRLQIIVFTCHWERYAALGAHNAVDLERVRAQHEHRLSLAG